MAAGRCTKRADSGPLGTFYKALRAAGCVYCPRCQAFMYPDHTAHVLAGVVDLREARYQVVGGYGSVRVVDMQADMQEAA